MALIAAAALAACATTTAPSAPATGTQPAANAATPAPSRVAAMLRRAGGNDAPSEQDVARLMGQPDLVRREGAGAAITYRYQQCALLLLFTADDRNTMRLREASPGARQSGAQAPTLDQCAVEADARS